MSDRDLTWDKFIYPDFKAINAVHNVHMKWNDYQENFRSILAQANQNKEQINVICPNCGKYIWRCNDIVYTSYPPKYKYFCDCGWEAIGY